MIGVVALGCASEPTTSVPAPVPTVAPGDYAPIATGMRWTYQVKALAGNVVGGTLTMTLTEVEKKGTTTTGKGLRELDLQMSECGRYQAQTPFTWTKSKTAWTEKIGDEAEGKLLALPLKYGTSWRYGAAEMTVGGNEAMAIAAGSYKNVLRVRLSQGNKYGAAAYGKDVGLLAWSLRTLNLNAHPYDVSLVLTGFTEKDAPSPAPLDAQPTPPCFPEVPISPALAANTGMTAGGVTVVRVTPTPTAAEAAGITVVRVSPTPSAASPTAAPKGNGPTPLPGENG